MKKAENGLKKVTDVNTRVSNGKHVLAYGEYFLNFNIGNIVTTYVSLNKCVFIQFYYNINTFL